jgi:plastocyanin
MTNRLFLLGAIAAGLLLALVGALSISSTAAQSADSSQGQGSMTEDRGDKPSYVYALNKKYLDYENGVFRVRAGDGGAIAPLTAFFPSHAEIKVGETVEFYNPTRVAEPHNVTFIMDQSYYADFAAPFIIADGTSPAPAVPDSNTDPVVMPGPDGTSIIVAVNARSMNPVVIDSAGNATYLPVNANYTLTGGEKYINSGWFWPKGMVPPGLAPLESFSVTFNQAGTYNYICVVHPWMTGDVVVS